MPDKKENSDTGFFDWFTFKKEPAAAPTPAAKPQSVEEADLDMLGKMEKGKR